jgi:hypothetical protein
MLRYVMLSFVLCTVLAHDLAKADASRDALQQLGSVRTREQLDTSVSSAKRSGVSSQQITEAKLLFGIKSQDSAYLVSLIPELESAALEFTPQRSLAGIANVEQWRGLIAYVRAMAAMERGSTDVFRDKVMEGMWQFPQQAQLFGELIEKFQLQEKMNQWVIDFATPLLEAGASEKTLGELIGSKKALLLIFWAGNVESSVSALDTAQKLADYVKASGVVVATVNGGIKDAEEITEKTRDDKKLSIPCLMETSQRTLVRQLEITTLPRAVLITQQGRVIFHGHPSDLSIWKALKRVVPTIRPLGE